MKKAVFTLIICSTIFASCGGGGEQQQQANETGGTAVAESKKKPDNDLQKEHLSGNVVSVRQRVYWALEKFGRLDKGKLQNLPNHDFLKVYDKDGYLIEETHYDVNDKVVSNKKIEYGKSHRISKEEFYKGDSLDEYIVYTYDDNGKLTKKEKFGANGKIKESNGYIYYPDGLLQDEDLFKANGELSCKFVYIYDNSKLVEKQKYWGGGTLAQKEYFTYNANGNLSGVTVEKYNNKIASFVSRTGYEGYNLFGDYLAKTSYDEQGEEKSKTYYVYDPQGNLTEAIIKTTNVIVKMVEVVDEAPIEETTGYDSIDGESVATTTEIRLEELKTQTEHQSGNTYTYEYDDNKNWIKKITYKVNDFDAPEEKTRQFYYERVISYK